ncbi:MAG: hypothetical protein LBI81_00285 [Puniceicoccales bacterium]|jgi:DNA polymerase-3 subunit delta|nr:hypothetical protein [Puniceicoccales bacterium]
MKNNNKSVTFVYGSDDFLVDRRARFIFNDACQGRGEIFTCDSSRNLASTLGNIISALATVPLFDDSATVWLRSVCFLGEIPLAEDDKNLITQLLESIRASSDRRIIISATGVDRRMKIFKNLEEIADAVNLDDEPESKAIDLTIGEFAEANRTKIDPSAAKLLRMKCGNNFRLLEQEINKLSTYIFGQRSHISEGDVATLVDDYDTENFFEPVEKFFENNIAAALQAMDRYFFSNSDAIPLLLALQARNRALIQMRALIDARHVKVVHSGVVKNDFIRAAQIFHMENLNRSTFNIFSQNIWYLSKLVPLCLKFKLRRLIKFQTLFSSAIATAFDRSQDQKTIMKELILKCLCQSLAGL